MATERIPAGISDQTAYYTADQNTILYIDGEQELTNLNKSARTLASIQVGQKCRVWNQTANPLICDLVSNQVDQILFNTASTAGNLRLTIQKTDGTFVLTANAAYNAVDATFLAAINAQLDASTGVVGGIVATAIPATDTDFGIRLTYSGTGYAGLLWTAAVVNTFPTGPTSATYTQITSSRASFSDRSATALPFHFQPGGPTSVWNVAKFLGNRGGRQLGGRAKEVHQRSGEGYANSSSRVDAAYIYGGSYRADYNANRFTDLILQDCAFNTQRGFSGTAEVYSGTMATFKRADSSGGTVDACGVLRILGGQVDYMLGTISELHWKGAGEFRCRDAGIDFTISKLYISSANKRKLLDQLKAANCTVTLPTVIGVNLFVYGDETDDLA